MLQITPKDKCNVRLEAVFERSVGFAAWQALSPAREVPTQGSTSLDSVDATVWQGAISAMVIIFSSEGKDSELYLDPANWLAVPDPTEILLGNSDMIQSETLQHAWQQLTPTQVVHMIIILYLHAYEVHKQQPSSVQAKPPTDSTQELKAQPAMEAARSAAKADKAKHLARTSFQEQSDAAVLQRPQAQEEVQGLQHTAQNATSADVNGKSEFRPESVCQEPHNADNSQPVETHVADASQQAESIIESAADVEQSAKGMTRTLCCAALTLRLILADGCHSDATKASSTMLWEVLQDFCTQLQQLETDDTPSSPLEPSNEQTRKSEESAAIAMVRLVYQALKQNLGVGEHPANHGHTCLLAVRYLACTSWHARSVTAAEFVRLGMLYSALKLHWCMCQHCICFYCICYDCMCMGHHRRIVIWQHNRHPQYLYDIIGNFVVCCIGSHAPFWS